MAHTHLFAALRRLLQRQRLADRLEQRTGMAATSWMAPDLPRRELLAMLAAAGVAPLVGCTKTLPGSANAAATIGPDGLTRKAGDSGLDAQAATTKDTGQSKNTGTIAIIGGGLAGLHCALRLWKDHGIAATVYEGQSRLGGRCYTDRETFKHQDGMHSELGGEFIDSDHVVMHALCKEFDLPLLDYETGDPKLDDLVHFALGKQWSEEDLLADWKPLGKAIAAAAAKVRKSGEMPSYRSTQGAEAIDKQSMAEFLDAAKTSGALRNLVDITFTGEFGLDPGLQSALNLIDMADPSGDGIDLLSGSDERYALKGGNDALATKLVTALPAGTVQPGHILQKLAKLSDGRYALTLAASGTTIEVKADRVVIALPFTALRKVEMVDLGLPAAKAKCIAELAYGTNAKLMVGFKSRLWRKAGSDGTVLTDIGFQQCWDTSLLQSSTDAGILVNFTGGQKGVQIGMGSPANQRDAFLNQLEAVVPGAKKASTADVARMHWPTVPWVEGSYACYKPGHYTTLRGAEGERVGNLHFCGEHTDLPMQGFMEGAVASGKRVAQEIAGDLGLQATAQG